MSIVSNHLLTSLPVLFVIHQLFTSCLCLVCHLFCSLPVFHSIIRPLQHLNPSCPATKCRTVSLMKPGTRMFDTTDPSLMLTGGLIRAAFSLLVWKGLCFQAEALGRSQQLAQLYLIT